MVQKTLFKMPIGCQGIFLELYAYHNVLYLQIKLYIDV